jgi:hypothetical protein
MSTPGLPLTGGCGCGAVRFEISAPLRDTAVYCHCTRCQRRTGAGAAASTRIEPGSLTYTQGEEHIRTWAPEDGFEKDFCGLCGSALFGRNPKDPDVVVARLGSFDDDPGVRVKAHQFVASAAVWEPLPDDGLPRHDGRQPA